MFKISFTAAVLVLTTSLWSPSTWADPISTTPGETAEAIAKATCKHYVNRSRFKSRHPDQEFVVTLADGCLSAVQSLTSRNPKEKVAAQDFLTRLHTLRDLIIAMDMERVFGAGYTLRTQIRINDGKVQQQIPTVSAIGEYLIARELGLLAAYRTWLSTGPVLTLAAPDPLQP